MIKRLIKDTLLLSVISGQRLEVKYNSEVLANLISYSRASLPHVNKWARRLLCVAAKFEFNIRACHMSWWLNAIADDKEKER